MLSVLLTILVFLPLTLLLILLMLGERFIEILDFIELKIDILRNKRSELFKEYKDLIDPFDSKSVVNYFQTIIRVSELENNRKLDFLKSAFEKHGSELSTLKIQLDYLKTGVKRGLTKKGISNGLNIVNDRVGEIFVDILEGFYKFERDALTQEENELRSMLNEIQ
ncbi:hypothetical protein FC756_19905 [Lysinibacillus mangiferihumi]|uniref:Uncharacterized protein n=1 Tax=Lysinibacillus mangiferihumi TaxID=1130819 RepID=A0A4U2YHK5_9BACI|nr:hypothetical protein [Lysinibacillus mangiferihumi]TKI60084.1 hypothetical protein FC756_19905 [Lysinibacillus mangiferihumi]